MDSNFYRRKLRSLNLRNTKVFITVPDKEKLGANDHLLSAISVRLKFKRSRKKLFGSVP
jgi:hypothetical protein